MKGSFGMKSTEMLISVKPAERDLQDSSAVIPSDTTASVFGYKKKYNRQVLLQNLNEHHK